MKKRVVITGLGCFSPLGKTVSDTWAAVCAGRHAIRPIRGYDTAGRRVTLAAEVPSYDSSDYFSKKEARHLDPFIQYAIIAAREALKDAGRIHADAYRVSTRVASGIGGLSTIEKEDRRVAADNAFDRVTPFFIPMVISNMAAAHVAMLAGAHGASASLATACASSTDALGEAFRQLRDGYADVSIVGGAEASVTPLAIGGFTSMKALHMGDNPDRASIPFDLERSGFVMGEGAAILVLETLEHAQARKAKIICEVVGYGATCDAHHITAPAAGGEAAAMAMTAALADANLNPADVDYINAHGTSTPLNDRIESMAMRRAFGDDLPPVSSTKALSGHLLGAAGALEALICAQAIRENQRPQQWGVRDQDPECNIPLALAEGPCRVAMSNSLGFGGHNASLIMQRWED